jgi:hypothetical protein
MTSLALASLVAATVRPLATRSASSLAREELAIMLHDAFLVTHLGRSEMTNWSSPLLELLSESISSSEASMLVALLECIGMRLHTIA